MYRQCRHVYHRRVKYWEQTSCGRPTTLWPASYFPSFLGKPCMGSFNPSLCANGNIFQSTKYLWLITARNEHFCTTTSFLMVTGYRLPFPPFSKAFPSMKNQAFRSRLKSGWSSGAKIGGRYEEMDTLHVYIYIDIDTYIHTYIYI